MTLSDHSEYITYNHAPTSLVHHITPSGIPHDIITITHDSLHLQAIVDHMIPYDITQEAIVDHMTPYDITSSIVDHMTTYDITSSNSESRDPYDISSSNSGSHDPL